MKRYIAIWSAALLLLGCTFFAEHVRAQTIYAKTVSACGTPGNTPVVGNTYPVTMDQTAVLCTTAGGGGGGGGTSSNFGSAFPTAGTAIGVKNGANMVNLTADGSSNLNVDLATALPAGTNVIGHVITDTGSTTVLGAGTAVIGNVGVAQASTTSGQSGVLNQCATLSAAPSYSNGQTNPIWCGTSGSLPMTLFGNNTGTAITAGAVTDAGSIGSRLAVGAQALVYNGSTLDMARAATTAAGTTGTGLLGSGILGFDGTNYQRVKTDTSGNLLLGVGQASTTSGQLGPLTQCAVTTGAPTYTTAQTDPLSCDTSGNLRVSGGGVAQGSTTSGQSGTLVQAAVGNIPSYGLNSTNPLSMTTGGGLRVDLGSEVGTALAPGNGTSASAVRVTLSTDSTGVVTLTGSGGSAATQAGGGDAVANAVIGLQDYSRVSVFNGTTWDRLYGINGAVAAGTGTAAVAVAPTSAATAGLTAVPSAAVETGHVLKASAGNLYGFEVTSGASAGFVMLFNSTTVPADGAVTPVKCYVIAANSTVAAQWSPAPLAMSTGITVVFSTTGCFTKTASATAFISGDAK